MVNVPRCSASVPGTKNQPGEAFCFCCSAGGVSLSLLRTRTTSAHASRAAKSRPPTTPKIVPRTHASVLLLPPVHKIVGFSLLCEGYALCGRVAWVLHRGLESN